MRKGGIDWSGCQQQAHNLHDVGSNPTPATNHPREGERSKAAIQSDDFRHEGGDLIARLDAAIRTGEKSHIMELKQKCRDFESRLGEEGVTPDVFFESCFELLCLCAYWGDTDFYGLSQEACWAGRKVIMFAGMVDWRAFLSKLKSEISCITSKRERWEWENVIGDAMSFVSSPWWKSDLW